MCIFVFSQFVFQNMWYFKPKVYLYVRQRESIIIFVVTTIILDTKLTNSSNKNEYTVLD